MHGFRVNRTLLTATVLLGFSILAFLAPAALADCPGNVAVNPSFEEGFSERGAGEVSVANGWAPFWQNGPDQDQGYNWRPEYKPEEGARYGYDRIHEGNWAQKFFNTYATHRAGLYQQIQVPTGSVVTAKAWSQAWTSDKDNNDVSEGGEYQMRIGIDVNGGTDPNAASIVWSDPNQTPDQWVELSVQAKAAGGRITVYLRGDALWRTKHNDSYWDDVCVTYVAPTPVPTVPPTETPVPTAEPTEAAVDDEPTPDEEAQAAAAEEAATDEPHETTGTGTIRVYAFEDGNGDGYRDEGEPLLSGARIELTTIDRAFIGGHTTDGVSEPYAFESLEPGSYVATESDPDGYGSSSPNQWAVTVLGGTEIDIYFADQFGVATPEPAASAVAETTTEPTTEPTEAMEPTEQSTSEPAATPTIVSEETDEAKPLGSRLYQLSGILVAAVALVIPIGLRAYRTRA